MRTGLTIYYINGTKERYIGITDLQFGKDVKSDFIYFKYQGGWVYIRKDAIKKFATVTVEKGEE